MPEAYKPNWIRWYESDFWADRDVVTMTPMQRHLYRALLLQVSQCDTRPYLPDNDMRLCLLADSPSYEIWQENRAVVMAKFTLSAQGWENRRASDEYDYCRTRSECSRANLPLRPPPGFDAFWHSYPRKVGKAPALKLWLRIQPDTALQEKIVASLEAQKVSPQWQKSGGEFIPHPATWLGQGRWDDECKIEGVQAASAPIDPETFEWQK